MIGIRLYHDNVCIKCLPTLAAVCWEKGLPMLLEEIEVALAAV